jgi:glucan biosynthesis protein C
MDAMRGILMMLGLVYHAAKTFSTRQDWIIHSEHTTFVADIIVQMIHIFRMPTFFIISGYFAALTLHKYGAKKFLKVRISRIMIPLVVTALTLNSLQAYLLVETGWMQFDWHRYLVEGEWVTHLWFLFNLVFYFLFYLLLIWLFQAKLTALIEMIDSFLEKIPFSLILLVILPSVIIVLLAIGQIYPIIHIVKTELLFKYLPFFLFGILLQYSPNLLDKFSSYPPLLSFFIPLVGGIILYQIHYHDSFVWSIIKAYILGVSMWFSSAFCFYIFKKFADKSSVLFRYLSDISYTVYLFHHILILAIGIILIHYGVGGLLGMMIQIIVAATIAILIDRFLISKVPLLALLFNGKKRPFKKLVK